MNLLIHQLASKGPVLTDGAWGTQLQIRGLKPGECPDTWNLLHPDRVEQVARAYVAAGSQVILTNTFRANRITLADHELSSRVIDINRTGAEISRRAARDQAHVFGSIGPSGKMLLLGETSEAELEEAFAEQAQALLDGGADAILVETISDLVEAKAAIRAARAIGLSVVASMVFDSGKNKDRTMMGVTPEQAADELTAAGADVVGANCGLGVAAYVGICRRLHAATDRPIWIKPNAGLPELIDGTPFYRMTPEQFASYVPALLEAGASFIGGCCGTGPEFIRAMRHKMPGCK